MNLEDRLLNEFREYKAKLMEKGIDEVYDSSYYTALMGELEYVFFIPFDCGDDEEFYSSFGKLNEFKGNICESIIDFYMNLRHPEYINFFSPESLTHLIEMFIQEMIDYEK